MEDPDKYSKDWKEPPTWEELSCIERIIKIEEYQLNELLKIFKKSNSDYSRLLVKLINNELKEPRL